VANAELAGAGAVGGCSVRYLQVQSRGLSRARNAGLRAAASDVVVLVDDDMTVAGDWLRRLLDGLPAHPRGVATGRVLAAPAEGDGGGVPPAALVTSEEPAVYRGPQTLDVIPGANLAVRREFVLAVGGYDERMGAGTRFGGAEDNDVGHRLLLAGGEVRFVPAAVTWHRAWRPHRDLIKLRWRYGRGKGAFYAKHARDPHVRRRARADVALRLRRAARLVPRAPRRAAGDLLTLAAIGTGAADWLLLERHRGSTRATGRRR
jgi:GT2 family glycosyltransferase